MLQTEGIELTARREQLQMLNERITGALKDMDDEAAARAEAKAARLAVEAEYEYMKDALANLLQTEVTELRMGLEKARREALEESLEIEDGEVDVRTRWRSAASSRSSHSCATPSQDQHQVHHCHTHKAVLRIAFRINCSDYT